MISYSELSKGTIITINDQPYQIVEAQSTFKGRGHSYLQMKLKNLINGTFTSKTAQPRDSFDEAEIEKLDASFIYKNKDKYVFCEKGNPSKRFELDESLIGELGNFLRENETVTTMLFKDKIVNIEMPIKVSLKVVDVPPGIKGDRAQSGNKSVTIETGAKINAPLFINEGDIIEINTESGEYVRRVNE